MPEENYVPDPRPKPLQWIPSRELDGGGNGEVQIYTGAAPPAAPDDPSLPAIFYFPDGSMQVWDTGSQAWI